MQFQRRRQAGNVKADTAINTFFGTVGSPIQMSTFERHMEKKRLAKKQEANTAIAPPAAVIMVPAATDATSPQPVEVDPQPEPAPTSISETAQDAVTLETKKENKIVFHKDLRQQAITTPVEAQDTKRSGQKDILSVHEASSDDSEDDGADIATVRNDRGRARDRRRTTEFMGLTVEPVQQLKLDGARKAKIPHFMSAWFNADPGADDKKAAAAPPPIPVAVTVVTPPVEVASLSLNTPAEPEGGAVVPSISTNPKLSGMQGRGYSQSINFTEITLGRMIGEGAFGKVYEGKWRGKGVAVKVLVCQDLRSDILHEFQSEVEIMSVLRHPNICRLLGACMEPPHRALVVELMQRGSLWGVLRTHRKTLDMDQRTRFIYDTAKGMAYLHHFERPILHRDLKSPNLLVDKNYNIKLSDFGLARVKAHVQTMTGNCGTVQWMAPEVLGNQKYTEKADVFSFAIVLWEIITGECPYDGMSQIQAALGVLNRNLRPNIPRDCPPFFSRLMKACWNRQPELRPSFPHIVSAFRTYQASSSETRASRHTAESANAAMMAAA